MANIKTYFTNLEAVYITGKPQIEQINHLLVDFRACDDFDRNEDFVLVTARNIYTDSIEFRQKYYFSDIAKLIH